MYSQAKRDVGREWYKYMESIKPEADRLLKAYEDAKLTDDKDLIKKTGKEYGQFLREKTYMNEKYKSMLDTTTTKLANVNETALSYLNGKMPKVYVTNYNQLSKDMPAGISFSLVDETTVKNLVKDNPKLLPAKKLDIPKDKRWNQKAINAQVLQGIIQGESIPEMAKRLTPIMDRNKTSAIRNARTMTTSAQNQGRLDSYKAAQDNGVVLHKVWMATNSERTRAWHAALNGVEVEIDEPFENDYGEIMFPGDPNADPGNVYNCRCTLTTKIIGFKREDGSIKYIEGEEPASEVKTKSEVKVTDKINDIVGDNSDVVDKIYAYAERMDSEDVAKFNNIFEQAEFVENTSGSHYDPKTNQIKLDKTTMSDETMFHESTHWFDYNQDYTITDDWGHFKRVYDDDGNLINEEWVPDIVTIKEHAGFSQYIVSNWDKYERGEDQTLMSKDIQNFVKLVGTSDTYGPTRDAAVVKKDMDAINSYLTEKGISKTDPDFVHLSDFISAISYDSNLGSLMTGGHEYNYWVQGNEYQVTEITAGYNVLRALGREDLLEIERELAPNLMKMIEKEWKKIW